MNLDRNCNVVQSAVQSAVGSHSCVLFRGHWQPTLTYWSAFFSFGLCLALLGPTVLDLRCQTHSTLQQVTLAFFSQQFCLFVGSFVGGIFSKSFCSSLTSLAASTFIISVVFALIPLCSNLSMLVTAMAVTGLAMGIIDTISNLQLVKLYQKDSTVFLQLPVPIAVLILMYRQQMLPCCPEPSPRLLGQESRLGAVKMQGSVDKADVSSTELNEPTGHMDMLNCCRLSRLRGQPASFFGLHVFGGMVLFFSDGIVGSYTGFVYTYAVAPPMSLTHKMAGYLTSVFWAAITVGRLVSIPLSYRVKPVRLLTFNQVGVILTQLLLLILYTNSAFLFVGTCFLGLFISSVYPCLLALTEDLLDYKGCATTVLVTSAGMGEMLLQSLVGSMIDTHGSYSFLLCGMIFGCMGFTLFLALLLVQHRHKKHLAAASATPVAESSGTNEDEH
ncbi:major facilitator superfamily domain-containing protein 4A isoform 2-T2 [Clarias gariepinus]|uniref:major facilitator superfamily domain-containing protein 4A isoform X2 n=1 Tax=Clarias gariepinus TaxID=13013 RepID=UPI00234D6A87|nr:major facilitator superfamily domain-containing protein 4A isoform X2 [Clarias gariepinus]